MPFTIKNIIISRLFVLIALFAVPITIFAVFNLTEFELWWSDDPRVNTIVIQLLTPFTYAISWFYFIALFANRFSEAIDSMEKTTNIIPLRLKVFYGMNAVFVLFVFVFPLITPLIAILSFASMMWQATTFRKSSFDDNQKIPIITWIFVVIAALLPIFCTVSIAPEYFKLPIHLFNDIWIPLLEDIFIFSYCLCTALAFGSLFVLIANRGVSEYEQLWSDPKTDQTSLYIGIFEVLLTIGFMILAYAHRETGNYEIIDLFYNTGFVIVIFVSIVNFFTGKSKSKKFSSHIMGYLLAAIFMGSNLIIDNIALSEFLKVISLSVLAAVFIIVFLYTFVTMEESEF